MPQETAGHQAATPAPLAAVSAEKVAEIVKEPGVAVVDVRDPEEFAGGHIRGAINLESAAFSSNSAAVDKLVEQLQNKSQVVVHCAKSLQRGPASAAALRARLQELGVTGPQVVVMENGFDRFGALYSGDSSLVEQGPGQH